MPLLAQLDMPQRMCPYIKEHSLGLPRRLRRLSGGPSLRLRHPGDALIASQRFHMETPQSVLRFIRLPGDWMISLDLQDVYLQVPIHPESRRYLRFTMGGVSYQFGVLCFGLTTAPH